MEVSFSWSGIQDKEPKSYTCGYCGRALSSDKGWIANNSIYPSSHWYIYVCHNCGKPTFFGDGGQFPGSVFGDEINHIKDDDVERLYDEARSCIKENAFTASILCCRKLLMHIAVAQGAESGKKFIEYVEYLSNEGLIPPSSKGWVDHIRNKGNEANHEIIIMQKNEAERLILFTSMLLKIIYEFPASIPEKE